MANRDNPRGFYPVGHLSGGEVRMREYIVTTGATIFQGDLLKIVDAGTVEPGAADIGITAIGVAANYVSDAGSAGGKKVLVYDDPNTLFGVQADTGTAVAATEVGETANHAAGAGSATTGLSGHELDSSDIATGAQLKIIGKIETPDNSWAEHVDLLVIFNEHFYKAAVAGV